MRWLRSRSYQQRINYDDVSKRRFEGENSMNANSYITTDELVYTINHSQEIDRGDEMGPFAVKRGKYVYIYRTWQDARDEEERKPMWQMMIPVNIESLSELYEREDLDADDLENKGFWPLIELISKYAHTPLVFRGTALSEDDKEELRHRLLGYFKDHSFSEDYRNGRLDAMYGVMCQLGMEDDYDAAKGSYKAMEIKAGVENA